jgi:hypothetical protein
MSQPHTPVLSVVVPSVNGWRDLRGCLAALDRERADLALEVLVPERCGQMVRNAVLECYPWVRLLPVPAGKSIPQMRALAFANARAPTVAVIEDHVLVPAGWARQMAMARTNGIRVVGGGIVNAATEHTVDWAAFLCEYSHMIAPQTPGPAEWLTGNNIAYERALLEEYRNIAEAGGWEDVLHEAFRRGGILLWCRPDIVAYHQKHYTIAEYTSQRFLYARAYAGARVRKMSLGRRLGYGLLALALPPLLYARIVARTWRTGAHRAELARSLPLLVLFVAAWGLGEAAGGWLGEGDALGKVT